MNQTDINYWLAISDCNYQKITSYLRDDPELVNWQDPIHKMAALHYACKFGETSLIKLLTGTYKANVNIINTAGKTPLHLAAEFGNLECAQLLRSVYNADHEIADYSGQYPIHYTSEEMYPMFLNILGTKRGFNRNFAWKKTFRSFDDASPITFMKRSHSKDEIRSSISGPIMRSSLLKNSKIDRSALYVIDNNNMYDSIDGPVFFPE